MINYVHGALDPKGIMVINIVYAPHLHFYLDRNYTAISILDELKKFMQTNPKGRKVIFVFINRSNLFKHEKLLLAYLKNVDPAYRSFCNNYYFVFRLN
jgi:hypothetical protein